MFRISGYLQNYAWGVPSGLVAWRREGQSGEPKPEAELWYGAHPNGPSPLVDETGTLVDEAGDKATLLVKLLAAARPLSIQIHPPTDQAEARFAAQQADPSMPKLLADSLAKTEMLIAVRPFSVLQGLRDPMIATAILRQLGPAVEPAAEKLSDGDVKGAIRELLALPADELAELTPKVPSAAAAASLGAPGVEALALVASNFPGDPGVLVAALLDHRVLSEGQAVYVPAGVVHAYVQGTGVEVMTASDNVLRLGLTPKTIAVDESLQALDPELHPEPMSGEPRSLEDGGTHRHYAPNGAPFIVDWISAGKFVAEAGDYRLVLAVGGATTVSTGDQTLTLEQGQAAAITADEPAAKVSTSGSVVIARANQ